MKKTIAQKVSEEMASKGYKLVGRTSGTYSFRAGSNLARKLAQLNLTQKTCEVRCAARAGKQKTEGYQLLIFVKTDVSPRVEFATSEEINIVDYPENYHSL